MKQIFFLLLLLSQIPYSAQNIKKRFFKGFIDSRPVTLFLKSEDNQCTADLNYTGMYKYDKVSNWLQLEISYNEKNQFIMVEDRFSGVLILNKNQSSFNGVWISPDAKKQLKVELKEQTLSPKNAKELDDKLEEVNYENHDC